MEAFSKSLNSGKSEFEKVKNLTDSQNNVFLAVDGKKMIKIFHSPKNFGGRLLSPSNKVVCLTGLGCSAMCMQLDPISAFTDCKLVTPTFVEFEACLTAQNVPDLQVPSAKPENGGFYSYEGSNIVLPAPWLQDTNLNTDTQDPFKLIPIVLLWQKHRTKLTTQLVVAEQSMLTTSGLGHGEQELEEIRSQSFKLTQMTWNLKLIVLHVNANALPVSPTTQATNRLEIVEHMQTYCKNSP
jgi:hypothetical protein